MIIQPKKTCGNSNRKTKKATIELPIIHFAETSFRTNPFATIHFPNIMPGIEHNAPIPKVVRIKMNVSNFLFTGSIYVLYEQLTVELTGPPQTKL